MNALPHRAPFLSPPPGSRAAVSMEALAMCVRALDPGSRALLDLSLRRRMPFEAMAGVLHTDPFDLARRRARAVARIAAELDLEGAGVVATVKAALSRLPDDAWCVPVISHSGPEPSEVQDAVQAESMAEAARALMEKLREARERAREAAEQDTVESPALVLPPEPEGEEIKVSAADDAPPEPEAWAPMAATPMAAAFSHHPAFAIEQDDEVVDLPPLAAALAQAAASEREASEARAPEVPAAAPEAEQPTVETEAIRTPAHAADRPAEPLSLVRVERQPRRRLARGGLIIGILLAIVRFLLGRR